MSFICSLIPVSLDSYVYSLRPGRVLEGVAEITRERRSRRRHHPAASSPMSFIHGKEIRMGFNGAISLVSYSWKSGTGMHVGAMGT